MKTLGENLKTIRLLANLTQKEFAKSLNTTQQRVSEWETNKVEPSLFTIIKILKILNISFEELTKNLNIQ